MSARLQEALRFSKICPLDHLEVVKANLHVFKLAMTKAGYEEMAPRVVTFKTFQRRFCKFVLANSITLTPGTVHVDRGTSYMFIP